MARTCTICAHGKRPAINRALAARESFRDIAKRFHVTPSSLSRHMDRHMLPQLAERAAEEGAESSTILERLATYAAQLERIAEKAETSPKNAIAAIRALQLSLQFESRLAAASADAPAAGVVTSPEWITLRTVIMSALQPFSKARAAVVAALTDAGAGG